VHLAGTDISDADGRDPSSLALVHVFAPLVFSWRDEWLATVSLTSRVRYRPKPENFTHRVDELGRIAHRNVSTSRLSCAAIHRS
jgi:hypothetical protein